MQIVDFIILIISDLGESTIIQVKILLESSGMRKELIKSNYHLNLHIEDLQKHFTNLVKTVEKTLTYRFHNSGQITTAHPQKNQLLGFYDCSY